MPGDGRVHRQSLTLTSLPASDASALELLEIPGVSGADAIAVVVEHVKPMAWLFAPDAQSAFEQMNARVCAVSFGSASGTPAAGMSTPGKVVIPCSGQTGFGLFVRSLKEPAAVVDGISWYIAKRRGER